MRFLIVFLFAAGIFILKCQCVSAQNDDRSVADSLVKKFRYYNLKKRQGILYANFDKTIYTNNENVWFTAYLLSPAGNAKNDVLSAVLVKDGDHSIALEEKFVMERGISVGDMFLPDSIPSGDYSFILFTNDVSNSKPATLFIQPVTIKNTLAISFSAKLDVMDTAAFPADGKRKVRLVTNAKGTKIISGATVNYYVGSQLHPLASGTAKTDKAGQYIFDIPANGLSPANNLMEVQVISGKETGTAKLLLPVNKNAPLVRFYPEGGNLTEGVSNTIGWEVKNIIGNPYKVTAILYRDNRPADTIATNSYGMGRFKLLPDTRSHYYVKLQLPGFKDSVYNLPRVIAGQAVLSIPNALSNDTLSMFIKAKQAQNVYLVIHNYKKLFYFIPVKINEEGRPVKLVLKSLPKGIAEVTILDSLQRPCAERLFFAHYDQRNSVTINTDKNEYKTREQVSLNLNLKDKDGKPVSGLVSVSCIQANRTEFKKSQDIESYVYLTDDLGRLPVKENYMGYGADDRSYLEDILLIKGWRRYTWPELAAVTAKDTLRLHDSLVFRGRLTYNNKPLKKPANLILMRDSTSFKMPTTATGSFKLTDEDIYIIDNKQIHLLAAADNTQGYNIAVDDPYNQIDRSLAANYDPYNYNRVSTNQQMSSQDDLDGLQHVIQLKEVKINGGNDNSLFGAYGANECGDYVCRFNILNCPNHRYESDNKKPVIGNEYRTYDKLSNTLGTIIYQGCQPMPKDENMYSFNGINFSREFYPADYKEFNPSNPEYLSTIYWKNLTTVLPSNTTTLQFYTSDITGDFKIVVQGVCGKDVVYGEKFLKVSKP